MGKFTSHASEVKAALQSQTALAMQKVAMQAEGYAKALCPVGTPESTGIAGYVGGTLRDSISHVADDNEATIGTNVEYGKYVEFGTYRMGKRPFLQPAINDHIEEYRAIIEDTLKG